MRVKFKTLGKKSAITVLAAIRPALKYLDKGELISKCLCFFNSSKKRAKDFCLSRLGQNFQVCFEELKTPRGHFEIN